MTKKAVGPFDVKLSPQKPDNAQAEGARLGELAGLAGQMAIEVEGGKHSYVSEYSLVGEG